MRNRGQNALEYIILIGGVVVLSAASYFLMKGFLSSGGEGTQATIAAGSGVNREDLLNLGLEPMGFSGLQWYSVGSFFMTSFTLSNTGEESLSATVALKQASLSDHGVDLGEFEIGFLDPISGDYGELGFSDNTTHFVFETPVVPGGGSLEIVLHYNNSSPYIEITFLDYLVEPSGFVVENVGSLEKTDFSGPSVGLLSVSNPDAGVGDTISISIPLMDDSEIGSLEIFVFGEMDSAGNFSLPLLGSETGDFGVWGVFSTNSSNGSVEILPSYVNGTVFVDIVVPEPGVYRFNISALDVWGNNGSGAVSISVSGGGSSPRGCADTPPMVLLNGNLTDELQYLDGSSAAVWKFSDGFWENPENLTLDGTTHHMITDYDSYCRLWGHWMIGTGGLSSYQASYFDGENWGGVLNLSEDFDAVPPEYATNMRIADIDLSKDGSKALFLWSERDGGNTDVWARLWDGDSWGLPENVSVSPPQLDAVPVVAFAPGGNKALAVWFREPLGLMSALWDSSTGWGSPVFAESGNFTYKELVFDGNRAIAVFEKNMNYSLPSDFPDDLNDTEVFVKEWTESGGWDNGTLFNLSKSPNDPSLYPHVGIDKKGRPVAVWFDQEVIFPAKQFIRITVKYSYQTEAGTWTEPANVSQWQDPYSVIVPGGIENMMYTFWLLAQSQLVYTGEGDLMLVWIDADLDVYNASNSIARVMESRWDGNVWSSPRQIAANLPLGSCPFVYSFDGENYHYEHEAYAYAVVKSWEYESYETLEKLRPVDGKYFLQLREELPETSYTNKIGLRVVEHPVGTEVHPDVHGVLHTVREKIEPIVCNDSRSGDCLEKVLYPDSKPLATDLAKVPLGDYSELRDVVVVEFPKPQGVVKPKLKLRLMKTDFMTDFWRNQLELFGGNNMDELYVLMNENPLFSLIMKRALHRGTLNIEVWDGEKWVFVDDLGVGMVDWNEAMLSLGEVDTETLKIRFESVVGTYTLDHIYVDYSADEILSVKEAELEQAFTKEQKDVRSELLYDDDSYASQRIGDITQLVFKQVPEEADKKYSYVVNVKGYYLFDPLTNRVDLDAEKLLRISYLWAIPGEMTRYGMVKRFGLRGENPSGRFAEAAVFTIESIILLSGWAALTVFFFVTRLKNKPRETKKKPAKKNLAKKRPKEKTKGQKTRR